MENNPDLAIAEIEFDQEKDDSYAVAMKKDIRNWRRQLDKAIQKLKDSGDLEKLIEDALKHPLENKIE